MQASAPEAALELTALSRAVADALSATLVVRTNPLPGVPGERMRVRAGGLIRDLVPDHRQPWVCVVDGLPLRRDYWLQRRVGPGEVIELHLVVQGGREGSRAILQIVAQVVIAYITAGMSMYYQIAARVALTLAANALINELVPISGPSSALPQGASSTYNVALAGNQARLGQPIPVIYGRMQVYPDFAAQPYLEYDATVNNQGDQYYYALLCIGHGSYELEAVNIDDTSIDHFQDVQYQVLAPGEQPTLVNPAVVTALEVAGQEMQSGQYVGAFAACGPRRRAQAIGIDVVFPRGLGVSNNNGSMSNRTVSWRVEVREVNDFGRSTSPWSIIATESLTLNIAGQVRRSYRYELDAPARVEVRLVRTDIKSNDIRVLNDIVWSGLRSYLDANATLAPTATHIELRIRASEQLSGMSQRRISTIVHRLVRTWHPDTGWGPEVATRSIAWALADKWKNGVYGDGLTDDRIDLQSLYEHDQVWAGRQDRLDMVFDTRVDSASADQAMASCGRATVFHRHGVRTLARDQRQDLPVTAYTSRNMLPGSARIDYVQATEITADGVIVEYFDNRSWDWEEVECPAPGVSEMTRPVRLRLPGITGRTHAEREGLYHAATNVYRRRFASWQTEMQGIFATFGAPVLFSPVLQADNQSGDVAFWDADTLTMGLTEPVVFEDADVYIRLLRDDGGVTEPIRVTPGSTQWDVVLDTAPPIDVVIDDAERERTKYVLGTLTQVRQLVRMLGVRPQGRNEDGAPIYELSGVIEDDRVHDVDEHLLPGPGDIQDPVDPGEDDDGGGSLILVNITNQQIGFSGSSGGGPSEISIRYALRNDGRAYRDTSLTPIQYLSGQWSFPQPIEADQAGQFEVRATLLGQFLTPGSLGSAGFTGGSFGVWQALSTDRYWDWAASLGEFEGASASILIEIRDASTELVQDSATINFAFGTSGFGE
jgi:hypothetical protein